MGPCVSCVINASHTMGTNLLWSCIHIFIWFRKYLVYTQWSKNCAYQMALSPQGMNYAFKIALVPFWQEMWWLMTRPGEAKGPSIKNVSTIFAIFDIPPLTHVSVLFYLSVIKMSFASSSRTTQWQCSWMTTKESKLLQGKKMVEIWGLMRTGNRPNHPRYHLFCPLLNNIMSPMQSFCLFLIALSTKRNPDWETRMGNIGR